MILRFQNIEKLSEGEEVHVRPTHSIEFYRYRLMVNSPGVRSLENTTLSPPPKEPKYQLQHLISPNRPPFVSVCYLYNLSSVTAVRTLLRLKNNRNTQSLGYWGSLIYHTNGHKYTEIMKEIPSKAIYVFPISELINKSTSLKFVGKSPLPRDLSAGREDLHLELKLRT